MIRGVFIVRGQNLDLICILHGILLLQWCRLCLSQKGIAVTCRSFAHFNLLIKVFHCNRHWLVHLFYRLVTLFQISLNPANSQLQKLILSLGFYDLILEEVFVLLEGLGTCHPMLNLLVHFLLLILHLLPLTIQTVNLLVQFVNGLILQRVVAIF